MERPGEPLRRAAHESVEPLPSVTVDPIPAPDPLPDPASEPRAALPERAARDEAPIHPPVVLRESAPPAVPGYRIEGIVGRGSTGVVYRAVQLAVEREVALKVLHPELARNARLVRRLQREARTMARLAHPHVVSAIDMGQVEGTWWYAMELVDGPSLAERLRAEGRIGEREALRLFLPLAEAIEHLWDHGVVHRDIKPANVLIDRTRGAQLADLGLAFHEDDPGLTRQGGTLGTPHYISPEQARDPHAVDVRTDLWSFGATLFHALCGRPPFAGESLAEVLSAVLHARIPDPQSLAPEMSSGMALVLRKCLVRDEARRYQTPRELREDLERLRERRQPTVRRSSLDPVARPGAQWRRAGAIGLASGFALVLIAMGLEWRRTGEEGQIPLPPPAVAEYAPLEQILSNARSHPTRLAGALADLARMRDAVPVEAAGRWWSVHNELWDTLRQRVHAIRTETAAELDRHLARGDLLAARTALAGGLDARLRSETGFAAADVPEEMGAPLRRWRDERRAALEQVTQRAIEGVANAATLHYHEVVLHEFEALLARQSWRTARSLVLYDRARLLAGAGLDAAGLPSDELDDALAPVRADAAQRRRLLDESWIAADRSLRDWVRRRAGEIEGQVRDGRGVAPRERLEDDFARELERRGISRDEVPDPAVSAAFAELERAGRRLVDVRVESLERELRDAFDLRARTLGPVLLRRRDFGRASGLWTGLAARLDAVREEAGTTRWYDELVRAVERKRDEADRLGAVMQRAAAGVRAQRGRELDLLVGSIRYRGAVDVGDDPLQDGFRLRTGPSRVYPLELRAPLDGGQARQVVLADLEALAGFVDPSAVEASLAALGPEERLDLALLRRSEGDLVGASRVLASGPWPTEDPGARLAQDLSSEILAALSPSQRGAQARTDALELLARIDAGITESDPTAALAAIEILLAEHVQEPAVGLRAAELAGRRDVLRRALR